MWIVSGPFDVEGSAELSSQKSKLLRAGKSYSLGRKNQPLLILNKKISALHCRFSVEKCSVDDVHDPEKHLALTFHNERDKSLRLTRGESELDIGPKRSAPLQDGDMIYLVTGLPVSVKWQPVCCYSPSLRGKSNLSLETCCELGISIVYTPNSRVTHHILPTYIASASVAASLISAAQFVKLEWLMEILKNEDSLEQNFVLPSISKYRPIFSPSLHPSQKVFKVWEPNEERFNIFSEYRFLVFGEKTREIESDLRELIKRGGGFLETFDVAGGVAKLHKALTRGQAKEGQQLVVVADMKYTKAAIGQDELDKLVVEVRSFGLPITSPESVVQTAIDVEPSLLTTYQPSSAGTNVLGSCVITTSLPSCIPNSISDEPSFLPEETPVKRRLVRRAASRQPSLEPMSEAVPGDEVETGKPRLLLSSRRGRTAEPTNTGEPSDDVLAAAPVAPTPGRLRLKRRLGVPGSAAQDAITQSQLPDILSSVAEEPPLKKFKALFDASDPGHTGGGSFDEDVGTNTAVGLMSPSQSQSEGFVRRAATRSNLSVLREEEEESLSTGGSMQRGTKRTLEDVEEEDVIMADVADEDDGQPPSKKRAVDIVNNVDDAPSIHSPPAKRTERERNPGAPVGKPDTDAEFLKAVASTKKGKRAEDVFDREFNNLKISKPKAADVGSQQRREEEGEDWRKFTDFGDDTGLRGNFMVVLEMDVHQKKGKENEGGVVGDVRQLPEKWKDKPDFKKFKKKAIPARRALFELVVSEDNDFDAVPAHWKSKSLSHMGSISHEIKTEHQPPPHRAAKPRPAIISDGSDEDQPPISARRNPPPAPIETIQVKVAPRIGSRAPSTRATSKPSSRASSVAPTKRTIAKPSKGALFLDSDDDDIPEVDDGRSQSTSKAGYGDEDEDEQTLRSSAAMKRSTDMVGRQGGSVANGRGTLDDDSDDGAVFKGFGRGRRRR